MTGVTVTGMAVMGATTAAMMVEGAMVVEAMMAEGLIMMRGGEAAPVLARALAPVTSFANCAVFFLDSPQNRNAPVASPLRNPPRNPLRNAPRSLCGHRMRSSPAACRRSRRRRL